MREQLFESNRYTVAFAEQRVVGEEWNRVVWDKNHPIQYHRLYFLTSGRAKIHLYDKTVELLPGNVYFIPAFSVLQSEIAGEMNKYYIHFLATSPIFDLYGYLTERRFVAADEMTEMLFRCVTENYAIGSVESELRVQGAMNLLLSSFFSGMDTDRHVLSKFDPVLRYVDENFRRNVTLSELATQMNLSTVYFSNLFKRVFHISPKQYVLQKRIKEAQRLLLESELSIKEIAYEVGFENENYFSELFAQKVGVSALKFRRRDFPTSRESIL